MKWMLFGCDMMKQMKLVVPNDECLKTLSLTMLIPAQNHICHEWSLEKQSMKMLLQLVFKAWNELKVDGISCNNQGQLEFSLIFQ